MASVPPALHALFRRQHGVASFDQCREVGLSPSRIDHLRRRGDLRMVIRGVVATPSVDLTERSRCAAVCLAHPLVAISGPTAGRIWSFRRLPKDRRVHVIAPRHWKATTARWCVSYRTDAVRTDDIVERDDGIRVTTRGRTALDLARMVADDDRLLSIIEQAANDGGLRDSDLRSVALDWVRGRPWVGRYLAAVDRRLSGPAAESDAEVRVGMALRDAGVEGLERQWPLEVPAFGRIRFDLAVPEVQQAVEVDVFPTHRETVGRRRDAARDDAVAHLGWTVSRIGETEYRERFAPTIARIAAALTPTTPSPP